MDPQLISQKLESLRRCIHRLETRCPASVETLSTDLDAQDIVALNLTRAVQLSVDIALHWIAEHPEIKAPATMGESFAAIAEAGVISVDLAERLRKAVGFRNLAVHNYEEINWAIVFSICKHRLGDFRDFGRDIAKLMGNPIR